LILVAAYEKEARDSGGMCGAATACYMPNKCCTGLVAATVALAM
jgi:hypothetical protein